MTPDKLSNIEFRARGARDFPTINDAQDCLFIASAKVDVLTLATALRTAWAERDEARQAYIEAARQRNKSEAAHSFCDENKKDLRAHRDRLEKELEVATMLHFAAASVRPEDWDTVVTKLQEERDARPTPETVAKVREALEHGMGSAKVRSEHDRLGLMFEAAIEALRLLEKP